MPHNHNTPVGEYTLSSAEIAARAQPQREIPTMLAVFDAHLDEQSAAFDRERAWLEGERDAALERASVLDRDRVRQSYTARLQAIEADRMLYVERVRGAREFALHLDQLLNGEDPAFVGKRAARVRWVRSVRLAFDELWPCDLNAADFRGRGMPDGAVFRVVGRSLARQLRVIVPEAAIDDAKVVAALRDVRAESATPSDSLIVGLASRLARDAGLSWSRDSLKGSGWATPPKAEKG